MRGRVPATKCTARGCLSPATAKGKALCKPHYNLRRKKAREKRKADEEMAKRSQKKRVERAKKAAKNVTEQKVAEAEEELNTQGRVRFTRSAVPDAAGAAAGSAPAGSAGGSATEQKELDYTSELNAAGDPISGLAEVGENGFISDAVRESGRSASDFMLQAASTACLVALIMAGVGSNIGEYAPDSFFHEGEWKTRTSKNTAQRIMFGTPRVYRGVPLLPKYT